MKKAFIIAATVIFGITTTAWAEDEPLPPRPTLYKITQTDKNAYKGNPQALIDARIRYAQINKEILAQWREDTKYIKHQNKVYRDLENSIKKEREKAEKEERARLLANSNTMCGNQSDDVTLRIGHC